MYTATSMILSNVMQLYITQFAHTAVKEHVLTVVQSNLIGLKWSRYVPTLSDMELMLKVSQQITAIWRCLHDKKCIFFIGR